MEYVNNNDEILLLLLNLDRDPMNLTPAGFAYILLSG